MNAPSPMREAPAGYSFGFVELRNTPHLVPCEPFNMTALCGVQVADLSEVTVRRRRTCRDCNRVRREHKKETPR